MRRIAILMPCFEDAASASQLMHDLHGVTAPGTEIDFWVVDDGSHPPLKGQFPSTLPMRLVSLRSNVGHQRAIACGLCAIYDSPSSYDHVVVMDSDGEDSPEDLEALIAPLSDEVPIVVANRNKRSEGLGFRLGYAAYKAMFSALTGKTIRHGNFSAIQYWVVERLVNDSYLWNHYAATLTKMRLKKHAILTERGQRYHGSSRMNLLSLVEHGVSAISVFQELVFLRLVLMGLGILLLGVGATGLIAWQKFISMRAIPGWTSTMLGFVVITSVNILLVIVSSLLTVLNARSSTRVLPLHQARLVIASVEALHGAR